MVQDSRHASPHLSVDPEGMARIVFDAPDRSANVLTEQVMGWLADLIGEVREEIDKGRVRGLLVASGKSGTFIVGADIDALAAIEDPDEGVRAARTGQAVYREIEQLPVPTVCAVDGVCMGGGTELALACRYRLASDHPKTRFALPEVQLGILPAWGGTTRLPRLLGLQAALDLLLTGKSVDPRKARRIGLVEDVLPHEGFLDRASDFLLDRVQKGPVASGARRGLGTRLLEDTAPGRKVILSAARRKVLERTGGNYPAPLRILEVLRYSLGRPVERAFEMEATAAGELLVSPVSKNLVHVFRLRERARKGTGVDREVEAKRVDRIGVVGAGVMGGGIAQLAASHGIGVRIKDVQHEPISHALRHAEKLFEKAVDRGKLDEREASQAKERISGGLDYSGFGQVDLVVEAVVERMDVKRSVFGELERETPVHCVLASNTSSLSITELARDLERPGRTLGMHYFNPVHKMPLVEVVRGEETRDEAVATVYALALRMGKVPVVVKDGPGFLVNRVLGPYLNEAGYLLAEGVPVEEIDGAAKEFGMPMGPLRLIDEVGVDVMRHAGDVLHAAFGERLEPAPPLVALGESDRLGRKGGKGFYRFENDREVGVDPTVYDLLGTTVPERRRNPLEVEIWARLLLPMINEAAHLLSEGIATSAADVDLAMVMGTGFPPFRGGLLRYADEVHPRVLVERLEQYRETLGERFAPASGLERLAREDQGFYRAYPAEVG